MFWIRLSWTLCRSKRISRSRTCSKNCWQPKIRWVCSTLMTRGPMSGIWKICGKRKGDGRLQTYRHKPPDPQLTSVTQVPDHLPSNRVSIARIRQQGLAGSHADRARLYRRARTTMATLRKYPAAAAGRHSVQELQQIPSSGHGARTPSGHRVVILDEEMLAQTEAKAVEALCTEGIFAVAGSDPGRRPIRARHTQASFKRKEPHRNHRQRTDRSAQAGVAPALPKRDR